MHKRISQSNIGIIPNKSDVLVPGKVYLVPSDYALHNKPSGCFLFASDGNTQSKASVFFSDSYPPQMGYSYHSGYIDCFKTFGQTVAYKYMWLEGGQAVFCDTESFDLYDILLNIANNSSEKSDSIAMQKSGFLSSLFKSKQSPDSSVLNRNDNDIKFWRNGIVAIENEVCVVKIFWYKKSIQKYFGDSVVELSDSFVFSINGRIFWIMRIKDNALNSFEKVSFALYDNTNKKEYIYEVEDYVYYVELPKGIDVSNISVSWLNLDNHSRRCVPLTYSLEERHGERVEKLKHLFCKLNEIGIEINAEEDAKSFLLNPKLIEPSIKFFTEQLEFYALLTERKLDPKKYFTFSVKTTYDRHFYIEARLADTAIDIQTNADNSAFYVTFDGTRIEEIELMFLPRMKDVRGYSVSFGVYNYPEFQLEDEETFRYLHDHSFSVRLQSQVTVFSRRHSITKYDCFFQRIVLTFNKQNEQKRNKLHKEMLEQGRVKVKWVNEYALYRLIKKFVGNAEYQYQTLWLGNQSIDIYLPSQNIAIEYQGQQHYKAIDIFGGEDALARNIERDSRKRKLCEDNGVTLLEWPYTIAVNEDAVLSFIEKNSIKFVENAVEVNTGDDVTKKVEMAPALYLEGEVRVRKERVSRPLKEKVQTYIVKQYTLAGDFVSQYMSYKEAASATSILSGQISSAATGKQKTAGNYQWRKIKLDDIANISDVLASTESISPLETGKYTNEGYTGNKGTPIFQVSLEGDIVAKFDSIRQASQLVGVNNKSIRAVLNGTQKTAAGFHWRYVSASEGSEF